MSSYATALGLTSYLAWGIATSPLPLAGLAVILLARNPGKAAGVFTAAWFCCQLVALSVFAFASHQLVRIQVGAEEKQTIAYLLLGTGAVMLLAGLAIGYRDRRHPNPRNGQRTRDFLRRAEHAGPADAVKLAVLTALLNITNVPYWVAIGLIIERSKVDGLDRISLIVSASLVASVTFIVITAVVLMTGDRSKALLAKGRDFVLRHSSSVVPGFLIGSSIGLFLVAADDLGWI